MDIVLSRGLYIQGRYIRRIKRKIHIVPQSSSGKIAKLFSAYSYVQYQYYKYYTEDTFEPLNFIKTIIRTRTVLYIRNIRWSLFAKSIFRYSTGKCYMVYSILQKYQREHNTADFPGYIMLSVKTSLHNTGYL